MNISEKDIKRIDAARKKVHSQFPKAFLSQVSNKYTIVQEDSDLNVKDILTEICMSAQDTPLKAWEMAALAVRTIRNFNRTHPLRLEGMDFADKIIRINDRKSRSRTEKPSKNNKVRDNYYIHGRIS